MEANRIDPADDDGILTSTLENQRSSKTEPPEIILRASSFQNVLLAAVCAAVHVTEVAWSPGMFEILINMFGEEDWKKKCREVFLPPDSEAAAHLPDQNEADSRFDLNTLAFFIGGMQTYTAGQRLCIALGSDANPVQTFQVDSNMYESCISDLSLHEKCQWTRHLAFTVFSFRQRWAHQGSCLSPLECLDALLAVQELWPVLVPDVKNTEVPLEESHWAFGWIVLQKAIDLVGQLCKVTWSVMSTACTRLSCTEEMTYKIVGYHTLQIIEPCLLRLLRHVTDGKCQTQNDWTLLRLFVHTPRRAQVSVDELQWRSNCATRITDYISMTSSSTQQRHEEHQHVLARFSSGLHDLMRVRKMIFHAKPATFAHVSSGVKGSLKLARLLSDRLCIDQLEPICSSLDALKVVKATESTARGLCDSKIDILLVLDMACLNQRTPTRHHLSLQQPRARPRLVGREKDLTECIHYVKCGKPLVIIGATGIGKTALAVEIAHKLRESCPVQLWVPASSSNLICLSLRRYQHLLSYRKVSPLEAKTSSNISLAVMDGLDTPGRLEETRNVELLQGSAVVATSPGNSHISWKQLSRKVRVHHLLPFSVSQTVAMLKMSLTRFDRDHQELAKFVLYPQTGEFLNEQLSRPACVRTLTTWIKRQKVAATSAYLSHTAVWTADVSHFHSDGTESLCSSELPLMNTDQKILLMCFSLLGRRSPYVPRWFFQGVAGYDDPQLGYCQQFLGSQAQTFADRRCSALQSLSRCNIVEWHENEQAYAVCLPIQRLVEYQFRVTTESSMEDRISTDTVGSAACGVLLQQFRHIVSSNPPRVQDDIPKSLRRLLLISSSLLLTLPELKCHMKLKLCTWLARCSALYWLNLPRAAIQYSHCVKYIQTKGNLGACPVDYAIVVRLEYGMVLWRLGDTSCASSIEQLQIAAQLLKQIKSSFVEDPSGEGCYSVRDLQRRISLELFMSKTRSMPWQEIRSYAWTDSDQLWDEDISADWVGSTAPLLSLFLSSQSTQPDEAARVVALSWKAFFEKDYLGLCESLIDLYAQAVDDATTIDIISTAIAVRAITLLVQHGNERLPGVQDEDFWHIMEVLKCFESLRFSSRLLANYTDCKIYGEELDLTDANMDAFDEEFKQTYAPDFNSLDERWEDAREALRDGILDAMTGGEMYRNNKLAVAVHAKLIHIALIRESWLMDQCHWFSNVDILQKYWSLKSQDTENRHYRTRLIGKECYPSNSPDRILDVQPEKPDLRHVVSFINKNESFIFSSDRNRKTSKDSEFSRLTLPFVVWQKEMQALKGICMKAFEGLHGQRREGPCSCKGKHQVYYAESKSGKSLEWTTIDGFEQDGFAEFSTSPCFSSNTAVSPTKPSDCVLDPVHDIPLQSPGKDSCKVNIVPTLCGSSDDTSGQLGQPLKPTATAATPKSEHDLEYLVNRVWSRLLDVGLDVNRTLVHDFVSTQDGCPTFEQAVQSLAYLLLYFK